MDQEKLFQRAQYVIPGGVNSPVRAFNGVGGTPVFFKSAKGAYVFDENDKAYIDYVGSWGPMLLGHAYPEIIAAVQQTIKQGLSFGAPTVLEIEMAELICKLMPSIEMVRMVNSGTEATMSAIRLARAYTKRDKILKFTGCYHGHSDSLLVKAGSGVLTLGIPSSPGIPISLANLTLTAHYNDLEQVSAIFKEIGHEIAAIIVEPIVGNSNCILPLPEFLPGLRSLCDNYGSLLIFDEVLTGFRVALGGAQQIYSIIPDITTLGKIIGGGLPVGAFGGKQAIMEWLAPQGPVYQAGTLSGNPVAMAAGITGLKWIAKNPNLYQRLETLTQKLIHGILDRASTANIPMTANAIGSMFGLFFTERKSITHYDHVLECDIPRFKKFFHGMLEQGIYLAPSAFEAGFISDAHTDKELQLTFQAAEKVFATLK